MNSSTILQFIVGGLSDGCLYALMGLAFMVIFRTCRVINFALGDFAMLGGLILFSVLGLKIPLIFAIIISLGIIIVIAILSERLTIYPFIRKGIFGISKSMTTLGVSVVFNAAAAIIWGKNKLSIPSFFGDTPIIVWGVYIHSQMICIAVTAIIILVSVWWFFAYTKLGRAMRATADNDVAAAMVGIPVHLMSMYSFMISGTVAALAGIVSVPISYTGYGTGGILSMKGFVAAALGGSKSPFAAMIGGLALGILENLGAGLISSGYKNFFAFAILIIALLVRYRPLAGIEGALEYEATEAH